MSCERCGRTLVVIGMGMGDVAAELRSCGTCDTISWRLDGRPVELDQVLDAVPSRR